MTVRLTLSRNTYPVNKIAHIPLTALGNRKRMAKDCQIVAHVERSVRDAFAQLARGDGRKVSAYVERVLIAHLKKKRRMPGPDASKPKPRLRT
jgi:hypothetical protein